MSELPMEVWDHEVPVLKAVHGDEAVTIVETVHSDASLNPDEEYGRLARIYGDHPESGLPYVQLVWGTQAEGRLAKALIGQEEGPQGMTRAQLVALLEDAGVEVPKSARRDELVQLAESVLRG